MPAVPSSVRSHIVGYELLGVDFSDTTANLPHRIQVFAEGNDANQGSMPTVSTQITSSQQAGRLYGFGSPVHIAARIYFAPGAVPSVPMFVTAQLKADAATPKVMRVTPVGVATANGTVRFTIAGRTNVDGFFYRINVVTGDDSGVISGKIADAVNAVLGASVIASDTTYHTDFTTKWSGLTANQLSISVDTGQTDLGLQFNVSTISSGSGTPTIQPALAAFGNIWNTLVINGYGADTDTLDLLETFNGRPATPTDPSTGRYVGPVFKPFFALTGSTLEDPSTITTGRGDDCTIVICPAPLSAGWDIEAAANIAALAAPILQDNPELDAQEHKYPDMPTPDEIGLMGDYNERDRMLAAGSSTVQLVSTQYVVQDLVTTYHPEGETEPQFRYVRILNIDWNVSYTHMVLVKNNVSGKVIVPDSSTPRVTNFIKPRMFKALLGGMYKDLEDRALIVDTQFSKDSTSVTIDGTNPNRLNDSFRYKRSGYTRIVSTEAEAGFNFTNN